MDARVLVNENELYSMTSLTSAATTKSMCSLSPSSSYSSRLTLPPTPPMRADSLIYECQQPQWFHGQIQREMAYNLLRKEPVGTFLVRYSTSKDSCYALSLRVPNEFHAEGIAHYLIIRTPRGYKIKGFTKEFSSLHSLIVHHSIMQELLPCPLNQSIIKRNEYQANCYQEIHGQESTHHNYGDTNDNVVDIDADPDYQRILTHFRKSMANCK